MRKLVEIITASDNALRNTAAGSRLPRPHARPNCFGECEELETFRRSSRNLYERVRALFFLYAIHRFHLPLKAGAEPRRALCRSTATSTCSKRRFEEAIDVFLRPADVWSPTTRSPARWPPPITGWPFKPWPTRCAAACARCAAINGCSAWAIPRISRCAFGPNCLHRVHADGTYPDPARTHARAHGPDAQRLERHFLPGHGFPGRRAGAERLDRSRRARPRRRRRVRRWKPTCA